MFGQIKDNKGMSKRHQVDRGIKAIKSFFIDLKKALVV